MNYLSEINSFYDWLETNPLATSGIVLWQALMHVANKAGWPDKFAVAVSVLELKTGLKRDAIYDARNKLQQMGRIKWESRRGSQSALYEIISFVSDKPTQYPTQLPTQTPTQYPTQTPTIIKLNKTSINDDDKRAREEQEAYDYYQNNIGPIVSRFEQEKVIDLCRSYPLNWLKEVINMAVLKKKARFSWIDTVLKSWRDNGYGYSPWEKGENKHGTYGADCKPAGKVPAKDNGRPKVTSIRRAGFRTEPMPMDT